MITLFPDRNRRFICKFLFLTTLISGCSLFNSIFKGEPRYKNIHINHIYWNNESVGQAQIQIDHGIDREAPPVISITEHIEYKGNAYSFIFHISEKLDKITILQKRESTDSRYWSPGSFSLVPNSDHIQRIEVNESGTETGETLIYKDPETVVSVRNLYNGLTQRLFDYYGNYISKNSKKIKEHRKIESQAFYLLMYRKLLF